MIRFFKSAAFKIFAVVAAALLAGSVFAVTSRNASSPLTSVTSIVFGPVSRISSRIAAEFSNAKISFKSSTALANEVEALRKQVDALTEQLVDYEQIRSKNELYQEFLGIKEEHSDYVFAEAAIIGRDAADNLGSFTLNRGSANGIKVNDPVIYGKYLVGVESIKCMLDHRPAGFVGISLPPKAAVEEPAHLKYALLQLIEQDVAHHFACFLVNRRNSRFPTNAEGSQELLRFLKVVGRFAVFHGFVITEDFVQVGGI